MKNRDEEMQSIGSERMPKLVILMRGITKEVSVSNAITEACKNGIIGAELVHIFSCQNIPKEKNITIVEASEDLRAQQDQRLAQLVFDEHPDIVLCLSWRSTLSHTFLKWFDEEQLIGYNEHLSMNGANLKVLTMVPGLLKGRTVTEMNIPFLENDTLRILRTRTEMIKGTLLIIAINAQLRRLTDKRFSEPNERNECDGCLRHEKRRNVYAVGKNALLLEQKGDTTQKANINNRMSGWWFDRTKHIVPNHLLWMSLDSPILIVRKCYQFPVKFIVSQSGDVRIEDTDQTREMSELDLVRCVGYSQKLFQFQKAIIEESGLRLWEAKYIFGFSTKILLIDQRIYYESKPIESLSEDEHIQLYVTLTSHQFKPGFASNLMARSSEIAKYLGRQK